MASFFVVGMGVVSLGAETLFKTMWATGALPRGRRGSSVHWFPYAVTGLSLSTY